MALVLPVRGQADWDVTNNNALLYLQSAIDVASTKVNGVTVTGTPNAADVLTATSSTGAHWAPPSGGSGFLVAANNLSDLQSASAARTNLGLGSAATASTSAFDASGSASTAQANAESYTDTQLASEVTRANAAYSPIRTDVFNVTKYGAVGDGKFVIDGAITSGQAVLTSASNPWTINDVNKVVMIKGAANASVTSLVGTITTFTNPGQVTISTNATTTVTNALVLWATDDTAHIQAAIDAAATYAASHGSATVFFPVGTGLFYGIAGALSHTSSGNAQLRIPLVAVANNKSNLTFLGVGNGSVLQHWLQMSPEFLGSTLVSFGVYASSGAQNTDITANGNGCVIGGPTQPNGYGTSALLYDNVGVTFQNMSILTAHSAGGLSYSAGDMSGVSNCNLFDFAYGTTGVVPSGDFGSPATFAAGLSIGWLMPANGNNDNCAVRNLTCHGGYTFGFLATEHSVIDAARFLYCWSGYCPTGSYFGSAGATHAFKALQLSIEGCPVEMNVFGAGSGGIGPFIDIDQLDTESGAPTFSDRSSGTALASCLGTIKLTGLYTPDNVTVNGKTGLKIIDGQKAYPSRTVTSNYAVKVIDDTLYVNAASGAITITLISAQWTPNTYTIIKTDSSANHVNVVTQSGEVIIGPTGLGTGTAALTTQYQKIKVAPQGGIATNWYEV